MKNFLIIGASSGIGKSLAKLLSDEGNHVIATYNSNVKEDEGNIRYQQYNVLDEGAELKNLPEQLDGFIYCPGSINLMPFKRIKPSDFKDDFELQVSGAIKVLQEILPLLQKSDTASVVFFSTVAVQNGFNFHSQVASSKGALEGLTRALAAEFAPNIRVNAIAPSLTDTPLASRLLNTEEKKVANAKRHPLQKIGTAAEIAATAAFLLSDNAAWMTGQILHPDGGISSLRV